MLATFGLSVLPLLAPTAQDAIERGTPWYWPVGDVFEPGRILQGFGQYETVNGVDTVHKGLDIAAAVDESVRAPIAGTVLGVYWPDSTVASGTILSSGASTVPDSYGSVILGAKEGDWGLTVTHIYDITVVPGDEVEKGEKLGLVADWPALPTFTHVHLGVFSPVPSDIYDDPRTYMADALVFLGGRSDEYSPFFLDIEASGTTSYSPVAFVDDVPAGGGTLTFHEPDDLPEQKLDIVAHVGDYFTSPGWSISTLAPLGAYAVVLSDLGLVPLWDIEFHLFPLGGSRVAPSRLSVRITRDADGIEVYSNTVEFIGEVTDYAYVESGSLVSEGWPDADFYILLTHTATDEGAWDTSDPETGGPGTYTVEVTAEDVAGNIAYATTSATVVGSP